MKMKLAFLFSVCTTCCLIGKANSSLFDTEENVARKYGEKTDEPPYVQFGEKAPRVIHHTYRCKNLEIRVAFLDGRSQEETFKRLPYGSDFTGEQTQFILQMNAFGSQWVAGHGPTPDWWVLKGRNVLAMKVSLQGMLGSEPELTLQTKQFYDYSCDTLGEMHRRPATDWSAD